MGVRIQELPETTGINKEDVLIVEDGQGTKKGTVQQLDETLGVSQLKEDLGDIQKEILYEVPEELDMTPIKKYYANGVSTDTTYFSGQTASVIGIKRVTVTGMIPKWYDYYDFIDANGKVIDFERNITESETVTKTIDVPQDAVVVAVTTNSSAQIDKIKIIGFKQKSEIDKINFRLNILEATSKKIYLTKDGDNIQIRSAFDANNDIAIRGNMKLSENNTFRYTGMYLVPKEADYSDMVTGELYKTMTDDIAPVHFNYSYRGAGHGDDRGKKLVCSSNHGLTESNIGEIWTDASNIEWIIVNVISDNEIGVVAPAKTDTNYKAFESLNPSSPIVNGDKSITFDSHKVWYVVPCCNHISEVISVGGIAVSENGVYSGDYVELVERYDIINLTTMVQYLKDNVGYNTNQSMHSDAISDKYCTVNNILRFTERGVITGYQTIDFDTDVRFEFAGLIQGEPIGDYITVPGTIDYSGMYNMGSTPSAPIYLTNDKWEDINYPPDRMYQFVDATRTRGIVLGYNTEIGDAIPSVRKNIDHSGFYYQYHKIYPMMCVMNGQTGGKMSVSGVTYIIPLNTYDVDIPAVGWYYFGDDIYLIIDVQKTVCKYLELPKYMNGRKADVVKSHGSIIVRNQFVTSSGLLIDVDTYGSAIIKLHK